MAEQPLESWMVDYENEDGDPQHAVLSWLTPGPTKELPEVGTELVRRRDHLTAMEKAREEGRAEVLKEARALAPHEVKCNCGHGEIFDWSQHFDSCARRQVAELLASLTKEGTEPGVTQKDLDRGIELDEKFGWSKGTEDRQRRFVDGQLVGRAEPGERGIEYLGRVTSGHWDGAAKFWAYGLQPCDGGAPELSVPEGKLIRWEDLPEHYREEAKAKGWTTPSITAGPDSKPATEDDGAVLGGEEADPRFGKPTGVLCESCGKEERVGDEGWESREGLPWCPDCFREEQPEVAESRSSSTAPKVEAAPGSHGVGTSDSSGAASTSGDRQPATTPPDGGLRDWLQSESAAETLAFALHLTPHHAIVRGSLDALRASWDAATQHSSLPESGVEK
jgi:hypothetical protein